MLQAFVWATDEAGQKDQIEQIPLTPPGRGRLSISQAASGGSDAALLLEEGRVYALGRNSHGQLGLGHMEAVAIPLLVSSLQSVHVQKVACGRYHSVFLSNEGTVYTCGKNDEKQLGHDLSLQTLVPTKIPHNLLPATIRDICVGAFHTVALTAQGEIYTFGEGSYGQLGHGNYNNALPAKVQAPVRNLVAIKAAAGSFHTIILTASGEIYTFGDNTFGQLGRGNCDQHSIVPQKVQALQYSNIVHVAAGGVTSGFVTEEGRFYTCGDNSFGQTGHSDVTEVRIPRIVSVLKNMGVVVKQAAFGICFAMLVSETGDVYTLGLHFGGRVESYPQLVSSLNHMKAVHIDCCLDNGVILAEKKCFEDQMVDILKSPQIIQI